MRNDTMSEPVKNSVLVVDDEKASIIALTHILGEEYTVYAAKNGTDAAELAKKHLPDVVLLDIVMPEMDGYEILAQLKHDETTRGIPVIFISGLGADEDEEKGLKLGAADYINKPFSPAIVKLRVHNQMQMLNQIEMIRNLSMTDQLTGIANRRNFDNRFKLEWNHANRNKTPISLAFVDLDHFKMYNDSYGHLQGDTALQVVARTITQSLKRSSDFAARWGGEEFAVLLPGTCGAGAMDVAECIRHQIEEAHIPCTEQGADSITASAGVNTLIPDDTCTMEDLINGADQALYTAKNVGRNRVCVYEG
jgi:diguanylate cyclase (GGDEF)-like protein